MKRRKALVRGGSALSVAWAAGCAFVYWRAFGHRPFDRVRIFTPADFGVPHESLDVRTDDGVRLVAWYLPGRREAAVVVSGGYRGQAGDVLGISSALQRAGYHVFVYGWRGTPGSDDARHTLGVYERNDLRAVLAAAVARLGDVPIGLLGYSMGGSVSISVAASDPRVAAVISDSAFADPALLIDDRVRAAMRIPGALMVTPVMALFARRTGARLSDFRPLSVVNRIAPRPLLLIHGDADEAVPVEHGRRLFEAAGEPKQLWELPGVIHVGAYFADRQEYVRRVLEFFGEALLGERRPVGEGRRRRAG